MREHIEFGKRKNNLDRQPAQKSAPEYVTDFSLERPKYEKMRKKDEVLDGLMKDLEGIEAFTQSGHWVHDDLIAKERLEAAIKKRYEEIAQH